ncbi:MAG: hypothetical protein WCN92_00210 [Eubacteriales bacterium]
MSKKYIAIFLAFCLILTSFSACKRTYKHAIVITDSEGKTRVLVTDDNGKAVTDEANNVIVIVTQANGDPVKDSDGKQETQKVAHPNYYVFKAIIEGKKFTITIPKGWVQSDASNVRLTNTETGGEINLLVKDGQNINNVNVYCGKFMDAAKKEDPAAKVDTTDIKICGVSATKYSYNSKLNNSEINLYVFEKNGTVYLFQTAVKNQFKDSVDFEALMNAIKFK